MMLFLVLTEFGLLLQALQRCLCVSCRLWNAFQKSGKVVGKIALRSCQGASAGPLYECCGYCFSCSCIVLSWQFHGSRFASPVAYSVMMFTTTYSSAFAFR